jgi:hypothetical protein
MKRIFPVLLLVLLIGCDKKDRHDTPPPIPVQMRYTKLNDQALGFGQQKLLDLDGDNAADLLFSTVLIGDPVLERDRRQYFLGSMFHVSLLINENEQMPILNAGNTVAAQAPQGYNWYNANSATLAEKIIPMIGNPSWQGDWKNVQHKYIAIQVAKDNQEYFGWVEVSFDTMTEKLILHRAAIAIQPGRSVIAGQ